MSGLSEIDRLAVADRPLRLTLRAACWLWLMEQGRTEAAVLVAATAARSDAAPSS